MTRYQIERNLKRWPGLTVLERSRLKAALVKLYITTDTTVEEIEGLLDDVVREEMKRL